MISKYKPGFKAEHRKNRPDVRSTEDQQAGSGTVDTGDTDNDDDGPSGSGPPDADEDNASPPQDQ